MTEIQHHLNAFITTVCVVGLILLARFIWRELHRELRP